MRDEIWDLRFEGLVLLEKGCFAEYSFPNPKLSGLSAFSKIFSNFIFILFA
jgi:hypothetical protein